MHPPGWPGAAIAPHVGLSLRTGQRARRTTTFVGRKRRRAAGDSQRTPEKSYLRERWHAGCSTAMRRLRDLQQRGYAGSYGPVAASARRLRQAQGRSPGQRCPRRSLPRGAEPVCQPLPPRRATWFVRRREATRTEADTQQLGQWREQQAEVAEAIDLAQDFGQLVRQRQPARLDPWFKRATTSALEARPRFATGLRDDDEAVKAGVTMPWSTSPVEGHSNRLKMLKRQMVGRARLDLLSRRFGRAPRQAQAQASCPREPSQAHAAAAELCASPEVRRP